jgi:repressor LexA
MDKERMLSENQIKILKFINKKVNQFGYPPSVREIAEAVSLKSSATVHSHLKILEKLGYIKRDKNIPRAIEVINNEFNGPSDIKNVVMIPLIGRVAAGTPILAHENIEEYIPLTGDFVKDNTNVFMLQVKGDSMVNAGILDGDLIIVRKSETAINGEIIVALIDDEATVKRFFKTKSSVRLVAENENFKPIILKDIKIIGKVIGVLRKYF